MKNTLIIILLIISTLKLTAQSEGVNYTLLGSNNLQPTQTVCNLLQQQLNDTTFDKVRFEVNLYSSDNKCISLYTKGIASTEEAEIILNFYFDNSNQTLTANISATENYLPMSCCWCPHQQQLESAKIGVPLISETGVPFIAKIGVPTDFSEQYDIETIRNEIISDISQSIEYSFAVSKELETVEEKVVECLRFWQVAQLNVEHIWESGTMHQATWYSQNENFNKFPVYSHFGSPTAGAFDATIGEVVGIPLLIRTSYQLMSNKEQREAFSQIFTKQGFISLKNSVKGEVIESIEYPEKGVYYTTNTAVVVALAVVVGGSNLLVKSGKKLFELFEILETLGQKFKGCTNIIQYINKLKAQNLKTPIIQFQELSEKISPEKLENIIRLVPENEVDEVMANLHKLKDTPDFEHLISNTPEEVISVIKKDFVVKGKKGTKEVISSQYKTIDEYLKSSEYSTKLVDNFSKYKAEGGVLSYAKYGEKHKVITKNRMQGNISEETFLLLEKGIKPDCAIKTSAGLRYVDNILDGTARELKSGRIILNKAFKSQVNKDLEIIKFERSIDIERIEWHALNGIDDNALEYIKKQMNTIGVSPEAFKVVIY